MGKLTVLVAAALAAAGVLSGCGKKAGPAVDPPEDVYRKYVAACLAADVNAQWAMLSDRFRKQTESDLAKVKVQSSAQVEALARQLGVASAELTAAGPLEFTAMILKSRLKDPESVARYRSLGPPRVYIQDKRLRVLATTPDDEFTWTLWLVEESAQWKVDADMEEEAPAAVFRKFRAAYVAMDGKAQWDLLSQKQRKLSEAGLKSIQGQSDAELADLAAQLGTSPAGIRGADAVGFTTLVMKSQMKDPAAIDQMKALVCGKPEEDGERVRLPSATPDGKFTWTLRLVKEGTRWKVDEEPEALEVRTPGQK